MKLLALALVIFLMGCAGKEVPVLQVKTVPPVVIHPPLPTSVNLTPPKFFIITETNCSTVFSQNSEDAYFGVSSTGYQDLSQNVQELRRYILELQNLIVFYKKSLDYQQEAASTNNEQTD